MKFAPTCAFSAVVACLLAQGHGVYASPSERKERKLQYGNQYGHGYHQSGYQRPVRTGNPTERPTPRPTPVPTDRPTPMPTFKPSARPTPSPTPGPTPMPTNHPTGSPPTRRPTDFPTELERTHPPTPKPSFHPTRIPTPVPSPKPTFPGPTPEPTDEPSPSPSEYPTSSEEPSEYPTNSEEPSENPTNSEEPSDFPTRSMEPTDIPLPTIAEVICDEDIYTNFCTLIRLTGVDFILNDRRFLDGSFTDDPDFLESNPLIPTDYRRKLSSVIRYPNTAVENEIIKNFGSYDAEGGFTVFAPTNDALADIPVRIQVEIALLVVAGDNIGLNIVLNHIIPDKVLLRSELICGRSYRMMNAENTRTECPTTTRKEQIGEGNLLANGYPTFQTPTDTKCSNGIIQTVDGVLLPEDLRLPTASPTDAPTISSAPTSAPSISSAPSQAPPPCRPVACDVCGNGSQVGKKSGNYPVNMFVLTCGDLEGLDPDSCPNVDVAIVNANCGCEECTPL